MLCFKYQPLNLIVFYKSLESNENPLTNHIDNQLVTINISSFDYILICFIIRVSNHTQQNKNQNMFHVYSLSLPQHLTKKEENKYKKKTYTGLTIAYVWSTLRKAAPNMHRHHHIVIPKVKYLSASFFYYIFFFLLLLVFQIFAGCRWALRCILTRYTTHIY